MGLMEAGVPIDVNRLFWFIKTNRECVDDQGYLLALNHLEKFLHNGGYKTPDDPHPSQEKMDAEDAQELYRLMTWLREHHEYTRFAGESAVDWAIRLITNMREQ